VAWAAAVAVAVALGVAACGDSSDSGGSTTAASAASATDPAVIAQAEKVTRERSTPSTTWTGPTTAPKLASGKKIVYVSGDESNTVNSLWGKYLKQIAGQVGWQVTVIDGKGDPKGWQEAFSQALALKPDGIVASTDAATQKDLFAKAEAQKIPIVGFHLTAGPGPAPEFHVYYNLGGRPADIGGALADAIIADSKGKGRAVVLFDGQFAVARQKAEAMRDEFKKCAGCKLIDYDSLPLNQMQTLMPQAMSKWVQQYQKPFYVMTCCDVYYDFATQPLKTGNVPTGDVKLLGMDAPPKAYDRIRSGEYQTVSVPEPQKEQAYEAVDELNRAFHGDPPSTYQPPTYLLTKANADQAGGDQKQYIPEYDFAGAYLKAWGVG
jgi:ribose transport system substrate-binding protein